MNDERIPSETERYTLFLVHKAKSLDNKPIELWNNKNIHLKEQLEKEK